MPRTLVLTVAALAGLVGFAVCSEDQEANAGLLGNRCGGRARANCHEQVSSSRGCGGQRRSLRNRNRHGRASCSSAVENCCIEPLYSQASNCYGEQGYSHCPYNSSAAPCNCDACSACQSGEVMMMESTPTESPESSHEPADAPAKAPADAPADAPGDEPAPKAPESAPA